MEKYRIKNGKRGGLKKMLLVFLMLLALLGLPVTAEAKAKTTNAKSYSLKNVTKAEEVKGTWVKKSGGYKFKKEDGKYVSSRWIKVEDKIFYINSKGYRTSGWIKYRNNTYYTNKRGVLWTGWLASQRYYLKPDGARATGFYTVDGQKYYFDTKTGVKKKGWATIGKSRYYFNKETGQMARSKWIKEGKSYRYVAKSGKMQKSRWLELGDKKYYLDATGARVTGTYYIEEKGYYFKSNGVYDPSVKVKAEVDPKKPMVALTFDDGPGAYTNRLLNCLEENKAKATFFMVGSSVSRYKNEVKRMANMGCELGNHSYSHPAFTTLSVSSMKNEVNSTSKKIQEASGKLPTVFRLPYGDGHNNQTVLNALGLPSIYWSIDTRDWANTGNSQHTVNEVLNNVKSGDIILMHDIHLSTVKACETIIPALKKRGYQLVTVSQLAKYKGKTTLKKGTTYRGFR